MCHLLSRYVNSRMTAPILGSNVLFYTVQMVGDAPWESLHPTLTKLLADIEQNKQRAAAEILAGVIGGDYTYHLGEDCSDIDT